MRKPANDNCRMQKAAMDWHLRGLAQQYIVLPWEEQLECCNPWRLISWQMRTGNRVPTFMEAFTNELLLSQNAPSSLPEVAHA